MKTFTYLCYNEITNNTTQTFDKYKFKIMPFVARYSNHIQEDIKRGWSSWNFGQEGIETTQDKLDEYIESCYETGDGLSISGFDLFGHDLRNADIRELYEGYFVLVDDRFSSCIAGIPLNSMNLNDAITESLDGDYSGCGICIDVKTANLVHSNSDNTIHIFEVKEILRPF